MFKVAVTLRVLTELNNGAFTSRGHSSGHRRAALRRTGGDRLRVRQRAVRPGDAWCLTCTSRACRYCHSKTPQRVAYGMVAKSCTCGKTPGTRYCGLRRIPTLLPQLTTKLCAILDGDGVGRTSTYPLMQKHAVPTSLFG